jgi:hypothetical protein
MADEELRRLAELMNAMIEIAETRPELEVWASADPPPFAVRSRLVPRGGETVELWVTPYSATLLTWSAEHAMQALDPGRTTHEMPLSLRDGYVWGDLRIPNAALFARVLTQRMWMEVERIHHAGYERTH